MKNFLLTILTLFVPAVVLAQATGVIRGRVTDAASGAPLTNAAVTLQGTGLGVQSNAMGLFQLAGVPVGRYNIEVSRVGYESSIVKEVLLTSGKEAVLQIALTEGVARLEKVTVRPRVNKQAPLNNMILSGARMLSVEEANRYAGGFDDPARLVTAFAGVSGGTQSNAIAIRGNSPQFLQWRLEGVEAVNPTHFSDMTGVGGGILTAFSSQTLGNSDFLMGAFPAEYGNALSGVFDMQLRTGNTQKYEHTASIGTLGIDAASEGPISRKRGSSYLVNYRYSSLALASDIAPKLVGEAMGMRYQDLSFKLHLPTPKAGTFTLWGIGLLDHYINNMAAKQDWNSAWEGHADYVQQKASFGMGHRIMVGGNAYLKSALAATAAHNEVWDIQHYIDDWVDPVQDMSMKNTNWTLSFETALNTKFSTWHTNRTGVGASWLSYNLDYWFSPGIGYLPSPPPMEQAAIGKGGSEAFSAYSQSQLRLGERWTAGIGVHGNYFVLNRKGTVEPRASVRWQAFQKHSFSFAYGMHSRREKVDYYFVNNSNNRNLGLARAHHLVLSWDWTLNENLHLKVEPYLQFLWNVAVEPGTPFSMINHTQFYVMKPLTASGKGENKGVDITLERYMSRGWYYLATASLFSSRYMGGDGIWRNTRLDRRFVVNLLGGKEWTLGRDILSASLRFCLQGGEPYIPFDMEASMAEKKVVLDYSRAYDVRRPKQLLGHMTLSYKMNRPRAAHSISLQMINMFGAKDYGEHGFNGIDGVPEYYSGAISIPNLAYKIEF